MIDAILKALASAHTANPTAGPGTVDQNAQGMMGHLGGSQGFSQGAVGASVPQTANQPPRGLPGLSQSPALGPGSSPAGDGLPGGIPASGTGGAGLAQLMPLLAMLAPLIPHILAALAGGAQQSAAPNKPA